MCFCDVTSQTRRIIHHFRSFHPKPELNPDFSVIHKQKWIKTRRGVKKGKKQEERTEE